MYVIDTAGSEKPVHIDYEWELADVLDRWFPEPFETEEVFDAEAIISSDAERLRRWYPDGIYTQDGTLKSIEEVCEAERQEIEEWFPEKDTCTAVMTAREIYEDSLDGYLGSYLGYRLVQDCEFEED